MDSGVGIYEQLKEDNLLPDCLNLQDASIIRQIDAVTFTHMFGEQKYVYFWKSIFQNEKSDILVPSLYIRGRGVAMSIANINTSWSSNEPALMFVK